MGLAGDVPAFFELVRELGRRLLGHAQVLGDVADRRVALAERLARYRHDVELRQLEATAAGATELPTGLSTAARLGGNTR